MGRKKLITGDLTQAVLKEHFHYEPETGVFTRLTTRSDKARAGDIVGYLGKTGYLVVRVSGKLYYLHRLAWLYVYGEWPSSGAVIDHIDRNPLNNAISNLRAVSKRENRINSHTVENAEGVTFQAGKWTAQVWVRGEYFYLGRFSTKEIAMEVYKIRRAELAVSCE